MPREIDRQASAQKRSIRLLTIAAGVVLVGAAAYFILSFVATRRHPAAPDTHYTAPNGLSVYYESALWPVRADTVKEMTGTDGQSVEYPVLELASSEDSDDDYYQIVMLQRGDADTYEDFFSQSESDLRASYGVAKSSKLKLEIEGATVTARRYDIQIYYAVLATIEYPGGDVVYVSALTKLASVNDILNLLESVTLE
ncbi:MAG: hypothetical protein ACI4LE_09665 [Faecalibacterium sp.]